jgi:hypothetical protein
MLEIAWLVVLGALVAWTRRWRLPRTLHLGAWMFILLATSLLRAWLIPTIAAPWGSDALRDTVPPGQQGGIETMFDALTIGFVTGVNAVLEVSTIIVASWAGGLLRPEREPARVSFGRRIPLLALHLPLSLALCGGGLAFAAGALRMWTNADALGPSRADAMPEISFGFGVGLWLVALLHIDRLFAITRGAWVTRLALAVVGIAATGFVFASDPSVGGAIAMTVWCIAQLAAVRYARPGRTA